MKLSLFFGKDKEERKMKKTLHSETAYLLGILALTFGTALMEKADFGVSMVVAPAYLVYLKVSEFLPSFTFLSTFQAKKMRKLQSLYPIFF